MTKPEINHINSADVVLEDTTDIMRQYLKIKRENPGSILFFRLGDFYETFFEDAELVSRELDLTLTGRDAGKKLGRIPLAGIPVKAVDNYLEKLRKTRRDDIQKGYTTVGIHRDDFEIFINKKEVSIYASQGQRRTTIISLKLAESEIIAEEVGERPIILLDDFMSELDKKRIKGLLENIKENQVIITCTDSFKINNSEYSLYKVTNGHVEKI